VATSYIISMCLLQQWWQRQHRMFHLWSLISVAVRQTSSYASVFKCRLFISQSLKNKFTVLQHLLTVECLDIVCITETWLSVDVLTSSIVGNLPYTVFRSDRLNSAHVGACIITRDCSIRQFRLLLTNSLLD